MKPDKHIKKNRNRLGSEFSEEKERDRLSKVEKSFKLKKKMDWRDILMEEEDYFPQNP